MSVNLDLALSAGMRAFSRPVTIIPVASQPGDPSATPPLPPGQPYAARGVWGSRPIDVQTGAGIMSSQAHGLGIRALDFTIPPEPDDKVDIPAWRWLPAIGLCLIEDTDDDGQGGIFLTLKVIES